MMPMAIAAKLAIVALVVVLPPGLAIGLGAAHGIAAAVVLVALAVGIVIRRRTKATSTAAATSRIETAKASRYLVQLCRHAKKFTHKHGPTIKHLEWTDTDATLTLPWGTCT